MSRAVNEFLSKFQKSKDKEGICQWCQKFGTTLRSYRDYEEGPSAETKDVCESCRREHQEQTQDDTNDSIFGRL